MSELESKVPNYVIRKLKRSPPCAVPDNSSDEDYVDPAEEEEYYRQVRESNGFDVDRCPLPDGGIFPHLLRDKYDYPFHIGLFGRLGLHCYNLQKGANLELIGINKYNSEATGLYVEYITLEAMDTFNNSPCSFQTCVSKYIGPEYASLNVLTELCRLKVPSGPWAIPTGDERQWKDEAIDDFYKCKLPDWLTKDRLAASTDKGQFYELRQSDLQENQWLHLYAEFAFHLHWIGYGKKLKSFLPLDIKKVIIQTKESGEESPRMKLKANNAVFFMSFMANGDPSGMPVEYQAIVRRTMDGKPGHIRLDVDCEAYTCEDESPMPIQKLETPRCSPESSVPVLEEVYWSEDDEMDSEEEEEYQRQVRESDGFDVDYFPLPCGGIFPHEFEDMFVYPVKLGLYSRLGLHCYNLQKGTNLKLIGIHKYNSETSVRFGYYITLEAIDTYNNSPCTFQTCVTEFYPTPRDGIFTLHTHLSRLKVPNGPRATSIYLEKGWEDEAIDDFYKGKMPNWLTKDELAAASDKGQYYELQESDLLGNEWLHLYAEFAFYWRWRGYGSLTPFLPLKIKKIIIQTQESGEESPHLKLKANNAIFFMSFKGNGDPSGMDVEYQAIVRKTMDGKPGHICLEVQSWAYEAP
ncbi:hypothetical protein V5N11_032925 [Cardamine amara subsp. amara]|uniref:Uncharacterized protein n=1 Tax=Cardamine amara subsp. amara TaxID=228776 RepID=A0ABD1BHP2_CARAN